MRSGCCDQMGYDKEITKRAAGRRRKTFYKDRKMVGADFSALFGRYRWYTSFNRASRKDIRKR